MGEAMSTILLLLVGILIGRAISDFEIKRILGCEKHLYMTRTILLRTRWGKLMINYFHRSDEDRALHDHPWTFYSLILWRGYLEHTRGGVQRIRPRRIIKRKPWWTHRVELIDAKPACTLVWTGRRVRVWGFHTEEGWKDWQTFGREHCND